MQHVLTPTPKYCRDTGRTFNGSRIFRQYRWDDNKYTPARIRAINQEKTRAALAENGLSSNVYEWKQ